MLMDGVPTIAFCPLKGWEPKLFCGEIPDVAHDGKWGEARGEGWS